jgi:hypothetical protein
MLLLLLLLLLLLMMMMMSSQGHDAFVRLIAWGRLPGLGLWAPEERVSKAVGVATLLSHVEALKEAERR